MTEILAECQAIRVEHDADLARLPDVLSELQAILDRSWLRFQRCDNLRRQAAAEGAEEAFDREPFPAHPPRVDLHIHKLKGRGMPAVWLR